MGIVGVQQIGARATMDHRNGPLHFEETEIADYESVGNTLPVLEECITQTGPGECKLKACVIAAGDVYVLRLDHNIESVGTTVLLPGFTGLAFFGQCAENVRVNGHTICETRLYSPGPFNDFYVRGGERHVLGVLLPKDDLLKTLAALKGVDPSETPINADYLELAPSAANHLRKTLREVIQAATKGETTRFPAEHVRRWILSTTLDAYLTAKGNVGSESARLEKPHRIVRLSEDYFNDRCDETVSLADLCAAAGVGKSSLYKAFESICGESPLFYFDKRRLNQARHALSKERVYPGAVTRIATECGLTELGRFAGEYRQLFGELPSATLKRNNPVG